MLLYINNTLVLIHSRENERFGGFTSSVWESTPKELFKDDNKAFVFSLEKKKIYSYKSDGSAIRCYYKYGPCFGSGPVIGIYGNSLVSANLYCYYYIDSYTIDAALNKKNTDYAIDYEVFQIIFE